MLIDRQVVYKALQARTLPMSSLQMERAAAFAEILFRENAQQNLTRIVGIEEFIDGHLIDAIELFHVEHLGLRVLDIGSGSGVPGLLAAALDLNDNRKWILVDSEKSKAEYLQKAASELRLSNVEVLSSRVEEVIMSATPDTVMARAVGRVDKIANWIWKCSTWNNLVLFKSRGWEEEWASAKQSQLGKKLTVTQILEYSAADKYRVLINLKRN